MFKRLKPFLILVFIILNLSSCARIHIKSPDANNLGKGQYASLYLVGAGVSKINGKAITVPIGKRLLRGFTLSNYAIDIAPGVNNLAVEQCNTDSVSIPWYTGGYSYNTVYSTTTCYPGNLSFPAEAGKTYILNSEGSPHPEFWVEEEKTKVYVGGDKHQQLNDVSFYYQRYCSDKTCGQIYRCTYLMVDKSSLNKINGAYSKLTSNYCSPYNQ